MNLSEWAHRVGINKHTAYRWYREGNLPVPARLAGKLILVHLGGASSAHKTRTVICVRVSSHDLGADLDPETAVVEVRVSDQEMPVDEVVTEVGSGINGKRQRLAEENAIRSEARTKTLEGEVA